VSNGGTVFLYVPSHDPRLIQDVVRFLQSQPFSGVLFTRNAVEGTFNLEQARIASPEAPDIVLSLRWSSDHSDNGTAGMVMGDESDLNVRQGTHASLSHFDLYNLCIAAGPDFQSAMNDEFPTGNIDIVPTILWILGVQPSQGLAGRVVSEAVVEGKTATPKVERHHLESSCAGAQSIWRQYLNYSEADGVIYLDEGNGGQLPIPGVATLHSKAANRSP
jgi:hypothetical protein